MPGPSNTQHIDNTDDTGPIARLSIDALRHAQVFDLDDASLAAKLYTYHRLPRSPRWRHRLPDRRALLSFLGIERGSNLRQRLETTWVRAEGASIEDPWLSWNPRRSIHPLDGEIYKLYVSPMPEELSRAFQALVEVLERQGPESFKVGADVDNILRPDKLIIYVHSFDRIQELAEALRERLKGCPAHGVPFTSSLDEDGLLSWGIDPPSESTTVPWLERESWRLRVANRLAVALSTAQRQPEGPAPWRFALERLRFEGIDTTTWSPQHHLSGQANSDTHTMRSLS